MTTLPALTLQRPWGWLIMHAAKNVENRSWSTKYRGELLIHSGKSLDRDCGQILTSEAWAAEGILGAATLVDCHESAPVPYPAATPQCCGSPWAMPGQWHWVLTDPRPLSAPIPASGRLGLWPVTGELLTAVRDGFRATNSEVGL